MFEGLVDSGLEWNGTSAAHAGVSGDDQSGARVVDAIAQRFCREAAEYDGVNGADAGAGEHGNAGFGNHGHVDDDAVTFGDAE
ncbi:hypothetical protein GALL_551530 [mine drainage metagenome]|uniref:Uncharacterized protein n=1 Tax=mine drainage metagenome TaxID=410659 RepID=A0A1J5NVS6_9ZZZZ